MKKLLLVALIMGPIYIAILYSIGNFITRDKEAYLEALKITDEESRASPDVQIRRDFLHRQTLDHLFSLLCESSTDSESCLADKDEQSYLVAEVAKIESMLQLEEESVLRDSYFEREFIKPDRPHMVYDFWYIRTITNILLHREHKIPFLSAKTTQEDRLPFTRPAKMRFADFDDLTPLLKSFAIGAVLLLAINFLFPEESKSQVQPKPNKIKTK